MKIKVIEHQDGRVSFANESVDIVVNKTPPKNVDVLEMLPSVSLPQFTRHD